MRLYPAFQRRAREMTDDPSGQDDIAQEMALAIITAGGDHADAYYLRRAEWAALDYLGQQQHNQPRSFTDSGLDHNGLRRED